MQRRRSSRVTKAEDDDAEPSPGAERPSTPGVAHSASPPQQPESVEPPKKARRGRPPGSRNRATIARELGVMEDELEEVLEAGGIASPRRKIKTPKPSGSAAAQFNRVPRITNTFVGAPGPGADPLSGSLKVSNDEFVLPVDPAGEKKVAKDGSLNGDRDYRVRTFTLTGRGPRLYMLATEPARCMGFRDSYLLFQKHRRLYKIALNETEKYDLIDRDIIPHSYRSRPIAVVTARSIFREFGAKIIIGGRRVKDDYYETEAKNLGFKSTQIADPDDRLPPPGEPYDKNQYVAWHGATSAFYNHTTSAPAPPISTKDFLRGHRAIPKRQKITVTDENWMYEHALATSLYNSDLANRRRLAGKGGIYEPHTGTVVFPQSTQPTTVRWKRETNQDKGDDGDDKEEEKAEAGNAKIYIDTVIRVANPFARTGLKAVSPEVYSHLSPEIIEAIESQKSDELAWDN